MLCEKCTTSVVMCAMSAGVCKVCGKPTPTPHMPSYKVCPDCSEEFDLCEQCGNRLPQQMIVQQYLDDNKTHIDMNKISDGYHTFGELYYQRVMLFAIICMQNKDVAWKSLKHDDGTMSDGYFIVGVTTPAGNFTYHYEKEYWGLFEIKELEKAPPWDGHTAKDITRLITLLDINGNPETIIGDNWKPFYEKYRPNYFNGEIGGRGVIDCPEIT